MSSGQIGIGQFFNNQTEGGKMKLTIIISIFLVIGLVGSVSAEDLEMKLQLEQQKLLTVQESYRANGLTLELLERQKADLLELQERLKQQYAQLDQQIKVILAQIDEIAAAGEEE